MTRRLARLAGFGLAGILSLGGTALVQAHGPDPTLSGGPFGQNQVIEFSWRSGSTPPSAYRTAIVAAANDVAASRASKAALFKLGSGEDSLIGYGASATCGPNGIACFSRSVSGDRFTMWFRPHGYAFDWGTLRWCQHYDSAPNGCYDVENIALDEFGHIEGLGHHVNFNDDSDYTDAVVQTLSRTKPKEGWNADDLGRCDVAALQKLYDATTSTKISTCLSVPTTLTLAPSASRVAYNGQVTLTATLRVPDIDTVGELHNNLLSGRVVSLQRRPARTTTWTTVGTMTVGPAGTYLSSLRLTAATEFRAVFKAPSNEGLRADTSPVVTVAVSTCTTSPCPVSEPLTAPTD